jgi:hypothetical protein
MLRHCGQRYAIHFRAIAPVHLAVAVATSIAIPASAEPGNEPSSKPARKEAVVQITAPVLFGFFPPVSDAELDSNEGLASALEHFEWALEKSQGCLAGKGVEVRAVYADRVTIENREAREHLEVGGTSRDDIGCYLAAPGRSARVVRATMGPSFLVSGCPAAASLYFSVPECCPRGMRCCPSGNVIDEEFTCAD